MSPLELELTAIGAGAFPETPPIVEAVLARIEEPVPARRRFARRRALGLALAIIVVGLAAAFSVPQARSSILDWLGFGGVTIERVDRLPQIPTGAGPDVGARVSLEEARKQVSFPIVVPTARGFDHPDDVYFGRFAVDEVTLLYGRPERVRLLLTEAAGAVDVRLAGKMVTSATHVDQLRLDGSPALWIEGAPHAFYFRSRPNGEVLEGTLRLARNTLLWQHAGLVLRLEGDLTLAEALEIARSVH